MTPLILAVDTTHEYGSLALAEGARIIAGKELHSPSGFAHVLFGALDTLLKEHDARIEDIGLYASASGPGSFTGVRVGLSFVKGLAEAMEKPAVAVSNLRALASCGSAPLRAPVLDARRGEIYGALYDDAGILVREEVVTPARQWLESLPGGDIEFICTDGAFVRSILEGSPSEGSKIVEAPRNLAAAVARIAGEALERGEAHDPAALDANYVRRSDAELFWKG